MKIYFCNKALLGKDRQFVAKRVSNPQEEEKLQKIFLVTHIVRDIQETNKIQPHNVLTVI